MSLERGPEAEGGPTEPETTPKMEIRQEVRFAVVMYGGVSLAIYINGVAQELFRMVRATTARLDDEETPLLSNDQLGTEKVYRELGQILGRESDESHDRDDPEPIRTRFVVDILSGTSAGGINAIYLAKALANGQEIDQLKDLWIQEGDIEKLINDEESVKNVSGLEVQRPPRSLLNSQRMYLRLLDAFNGMDKNTAKEIPPYVGELDLFVTATDIRGFPTFLRLADRVVSEKRHRNVFHFRYGDGRSDFGEENNRFLAFAARCTSAFPFAFEPMRFSDIGSISEDDYEHWRKFFPDYPGLSGASSRSKEDAIANRPFGDGGYLDNKPFGYATDAIATRRSGWPVNRKLVYIEPSPEYLKPEKQDGGPNAIENVVAALSLARYETIREDLQRILAHNRLSERARWAIFGMEKDVESGQGRQALKSFTYGGYAEMDLQDMIEQGGVSYGGYHRLKVMALTDELAAVIARAAGFDTESDQFLAIRYLVRAWREEKYTEYREDAPGKETQNKFLLEYDLPYRLRRLEFVLNKIDRLYSLGEDDKADEILKHYAKVKGLVAEEIKPTDKEAFRGELEQLSKELGRVFVSLRKAREALQLSGPLNALFAAVTDMGLGPEEELRTILDEPDDRSRIEHARQMVILDRAGLEGFEEFAGKLKEHIKEHTEPASDKCKEVLKPREEGEPPQAVLAADIARHYYDFYEQYDLISYPILYTTEVGQEFATVEVTRISPEDAPSLIDERNGSRRKLAGTALRNFGAFLDRGWRQNDILWGRLDGAERIIAALLPGTSEEIEQKRKELIEEAHLEILNDFVGSEDRNRLCELLAEALAKASPSNESQEALRELVERELEDPLNSVIQAALRKSLEPQTLLKFFRESYEVNREVNPKTAVRTLARSTRVTTEVLERICNEYQVGGTLSVWLARLGWVFSGLVEVAVPRSLPNLLFRHWVKLLYLFEVLLIIGGTLFVTPQVQKLGLIALAITLVVHVVVLVLGDWVRRKTGIWRKILLVFLIGALIALLFLALVGADTLFDLRGRLGLF